MELPLLLAGPILRRVEPTLVSVWVALSRRSTLRLLVWEGRAETGRADPFLESATAVSTLRVGARLHLAQVTVVIPANLGKSLQADTLYSYDLAIKPEGSNVELTLGSLGMLRADDGDGQRPVRAPLGFEPDLLPSFAPPPSALANLNILYGSCRRPGHPDPDALALVDDLIFGDDRYKDPRARPHQLFLGGDQIYADDVTALHMLLVMDLAQQLIGRAGDPADPALQEPIEHVRLDTIAKKDETTVVDPEDPGLAYQREDPQVPVEVRSLPVDRAHFPEERRLSVTRIDAQLTSEDGDSHVISVGEFAALYLSVWSNAVWGTEIPGVKYAKDPAHPEDQLPLRWDQELSPNDQGTIVMPPPEPFPDRVAGHLYVPLTKKEKKEKKEEEAKQDPAERQKERQRERQHHLHFKQEILRQFHRALPKVQRALANVPTYMILDDHDVTDDYFLNPMWRDRVLTTQLGQAILRNAMVAYALFQDWGNDPTSWEAGPRAELLSLVPRLFPEGAAKGPDPAVADQIARLFGHDLRNTPTSDGRYDSVTPPILWHFGIDGPRHRVIALDNRTRRSYGSRNGPPGNVSIDAQVDQIPQPPLPAGREVLVVVAPLQVIGPPVLDEIVAPLTYRIFDAVQAGKALKDDDSALSPRSLTGLREMVGTNPDAIEAWAFDTETFEHLLERLAPYQRVVLLSGDVHYSSGTLMSYWRGNATLPARFAQFTSSGFKNVMPAKITFVDRSIGFAQQLVRANLGVDRIAWERPLDDLVLLPPGRTTADLMPVMRARLRSVPVLVPTWGWPDDNVPDAPQLFDPEKASRLNPARPPDWRWRVEFLRDPRSEDERPAGVRLLAVDEDAIDHDLADPSTVVEGYQTVAVRHQHAMVRLRNARQILFRANVGRVTFRPREGGKLDAVHEVYTTFADPDQPAALEPEPEVFLLQIAPLGPEEEKPPGPLRAKALEIPPEPG
jgi:hypothetical protein